MSLCTRAKKERIIQVFNELYLRMGRHTPKNLSTNLSTGLEQSLKHNIQYAAKYKKLENVEYYTDITNMYPNCTLPPEIDKDEWYNSNRINLYFKTPRNAPRGQVVRVVHANLNLYKLPFTFTENNDDRPGGELTASASQDTNKNSDSSRNPVDNKTVTVQIFYFKKPLKKLSPGEKTVRKTLLDTKVLLASKAEKTQWNITAAAQEWQNNSSRNYGITIIVKDEKGKKLPAHSVFGVFDCFNATSLPPRLPTFIMDFINRSNKTLYQDYQEKYEKLPTLEITTEDIPEDEYDILDEETSRKVRHERQKKNNKQKPKQHRNSSIESVEE